MKYVYRITVKKPNGDLAYDGILRNEGDTMNVTLDFNMNFGAIRELVGKKNAVTITREFEIRLQKLTK